MAVGSKEDIFKNTIKHELIVLLLEARYSCFVNQLKLSK